MLSKGTNFLTYRLARLLVDYENRFTPELLDTAPSSKKLFDFADPDKFSATPSFLRQRGFRFTLPDF